MSRRKRDEAREAKKFGVVLGVFLSLMGGYLLWRGVRANAFVWLVLGAAIFVAPFVLGTLWLRFFRLWMKLAEAISWVMTRVILSTFFYLLLTPVGLVMRILGKRPLDIRFKDGRSSYWIDKPESESTLERYKNQF